MKPVFRLTLFCRTFLLAVVTTLGLSVPSADANLISNGSFESNGETGQLVVNSSLTDWTVGPTTDSSPDPYLFVTTEADSASLLWGPNSGVNNGFSGSTDGGYFLGAAATYGQAPLSQTISGLTIGGEYVLSFEWAASQMLNFTGATQQAWQVSFGADTVNTTTSYIPSQGFSGWQTFSETFTASSTSQTLSFLATGSPAVMPFLLLDGVKLEANFAPVPEPSAFALLSIGIVGLAARYRSRKSAS